MLACGRINKQGQRSHFVLSLSLWQVMCCVKNDTHGSNINLDKFEELQNMPISHDPIAGTLGNRLWGEKVKDLEPPF